MDARHQLAVIAFTDAVGSSQSMRDNEERTLATLHEDLALMREVCLQHDGEVLKSTGDGLMMLFKSASQAVLCCMEIQLRLGAPEKKAMLHRIGVHLGDVYLSEGDAHGDGVNVAARLQELATPGSICLSKTVLDVAKSKLQVQPKAIGIKQLKGIDEGIEIFEIVPGIKPGQKVRSKKNPKAHFLPAIGIVVGGLVLIAAFITRPWEPKAEVSAQPIVIPQKSSAPDPEELKIESDLQAFKKVAEDAKLAAAQAQKVQKVPVAPAPVIAKPDAAPKGETAPPKAGSAVEDSANLEPSVAFAPDTDKLAHDGAKLPQDVVGSVPGPTQKGMHLTLPKYSEQAQLHWKTRDFQGMEDWIKEQTWVASPEGKVALRHWTLMADFKDWYLSQMRLYSPEKQLVATRPKGGQLQAWMLPGDLVAYTAPNGTLRKVGFESLPLGIIAATYTALLPDSQEPKKHVQGFTAMQFEQRVQKAELPPE